MALGEVMSIEDVKNSVYKNAEVQDPITEQEFLKLLDVLISDDTFMKERNITIFKMHYGLDGHEKRTITPIAKDFGIARSTARHIINSILRLIRNKLKEINNAES